MALDAVAACLLGFDIFRGLDPRMIVRIARETERMVFRDGQRIAEAGGACDGAIIVIAGRVRAVADASQDLDEFIVAPGSMIGETAMLTEHTSSLTIVAEGDVRAVKVLRESLRGLMEDDPALAEHFHDRLAARLQRTALELRMIDERLAVASLAASDVKSA